MWIELSLLMAAMVVALGLQPWRALPADGPPWAWLAWWSIMPVLWGADSLSRVPLVQPLSGACLLALMAGWPLTMLALLPVAVVTCWLGGLPWEAGAARLLWLGVMPATLAFGLGLGIRRWLPNHLFVYILGRGFFAPAVAITLAGALALAVQGPPHGISHEDTLLGRWLSAWGDAFLTGGLTAIFVAFRPHWLATYSDRLYLPR